MGVRNGRTARSRRQGVALAHQWTVDTFQHMSSRRDFLATLAAATALPSIARALPHDSARPAHRAFDRFGVQLYMVREEMRSDMDGTLVRLAGLGYREIEWWGNWQQPATEIRAALDRLELRTPSAHVELRDLSPERLDASLERAAIMGHSALLIAWTPPEARKTVEDWQRLGALLSTAGEKAAKVGIRTGYHNHDFEFAPLGDTTALEILLDASNPAVTTFELDCYWAFKAGVDPLALLRRHPRRFTMLHVKDSSAAPEFTQMDVGAGIINWRALLPAALAGGVAHLFVEHDSPTDPFGTAANGLRYLRGLSL